MKNRTVIIALALALPAGFSNAQPPEGRPPGTPPGEGRTQPERPPGGPERGGRPMVPPIIAALDKNGDGVISEDEIASAPESLRKLDKNGDGKLTLDELMPPPPREVAARGDRPPGPPPGVDGPAGERPPGAPGQMHNVPPIIAALDRNGDGVISEEEIASAAESLRTLDKNGDGKLTLDELLPPPPRGLPANAERSFGAPRDGQPPGPPPGFGGPQGERPPGAPAFGQARPVAPLIAALDKNGDGVISEEEIAGATEALRDLAKRHGGKLALKDVMPPPVAPREGPGPERFAAQRFERSPGSRDGFIPPPVPGREGFGPDRAGIPPGAPRDGGPERFVPPFGAPPDGNARIRERAPREGDRRPDADRPRDGARPEGVPRGDAPREGVRPEGEPRPERREPPRGERPPGDAPRPEGERRPNPEG